MEITIHRGTSEIGGSCVQLRSGNRSILLDAGAPLGDTQSPVDLTRLEFTDAFISHPHQDHYGMIEGLDSSRTIHIGGIARELIAATRTFLGTAPLNNRFCPLVNRRPVEVGPFRVTPYLMDHSAVDAFGFLIEAEGKRVYYSGDFRAHGRRNQIFEQFVAKPPADIDLLLMEGTMLGRSKQKLDDEAAVTSEMATVLEQTSGPCFLICSGQHIDRLSDTFAACMTANPRRILVTDAYTAYILYRVSKTFPGVPSIVTKQDVRVLTEGLTWDFHKKAFEAHPEQFREFLDLLNSGGKTITVKDVLLNGSRYFLKVSNFSDLFRSLQKANVSAIYSQWEGYRLEEHNPDGFQKLADTEQFVGSDNFHSIHTSGHATLKDLQRFAKALKPKQLIPIHTEYKQRYLELFDSVKLLDDGETLYL
ncbi:MAG: MBL fold metallo-hydrolase [Thermodesulfobacteriota bacterium]|nr:MBL fold metallo-hydrolase [Thermodesulfobacteriota bacterium]